MSDTLNTSRQAAPMSRTAGESEDQRSMVIKVLTGLFLDAGLSVGTYLLVHGLGYPIFDALMAGMIVAGLRAAYVIGRRRTVDGFILFILFTFVIGVALSLIGGGAPRFLLAKDSVGTAISGIVFLITLGVGRPMMYYFAQRFSAPTAAHRLEWARQWSASAGFRRFFRRLTVVWAVAFLVEAAAKMILILTLPVSLMAPVTPLITPVLATGLVIWTIRSAMAAQHRLDHPQATITTPTAPD